MFDLRPYNTFGFSICARDGLIVRRAEELQGLKTDRYIILGRGSDVLLTEDFDGTALIDEIRQLEISEENGGFAVSAGSGLILDELIEVLVSRGICGLENLSGIPGTVGAAPVQNVGAYGVEIGDFIRSVEACNPASQQSILLRHEDLGFSYRTSVFKNPDMQGFFITAVNFYFPEGLAPVLSYPGLKGGTFDSPLAIRQQVLKLRRHKLPDPSVVGNAGSFFKNPQVSARFAAELKRLYPFMPVFPGTEENDRKLAAGWLIDQSGCRGISHGNVGTWEQQALVLVNRGGAQPQEIVDLARFIVDRVKAKFSITLEPEVRVYDRNGEAKWAQILKF